MANININLERIVLRRKIVGVDLDKANVQAARLRSYAEQLKDAKKKLQSYKNELNVNWTSTETQYIYAGVDDGNEINIKTTYSLKAWPTPRFFYYPHSSA